MKIVDKFKSLVIGQDAHGIYRNVMILMAGAGAAKLVGLMAFPLLTRIYTPADFGTLAVYSSCIALLLPVMTLRYVIALPLPRRDRTAFVLLMACLFWLAVNAILLTVGLWFFAEPVFTRLNMSTLVPYWWLVVIGAVGASLYEIGIQWAVRKKAFKAAAKTQVWQTFLGSSVKLGLGLLAFGPLGLLIGSIFERTGGIFGLFRNFRADLIRSASAFRLPRMWFLIRYYREMPYWRLPSQFLLAFATQMPMIFVAYLYGANTAGHLSLALTTIFVPINLIGQTTGKAYYGEISRIGRQNPKLIYEVTRATVKRSAIVGLLPAAGLVIAGGWLFTIIFGQEWAESGVFAQYLSILLYAQLVSSPIVHALTVFRLNRYYLYLNIVRCFISIAPFVASYFLGWSATMTILIYSLAMAFHYGMTNITVLSMVRKQSELTA